MKTLVELKHVSKSYPKIGQGSSRLSALKSALLNQPYKDTHRIIKDINLSVRQGESLGIIGENGAGKSTLLKLISGVLRPTTGQIVCNGRIAALLELGAGFHPEYSGLENIRMNAALSGLSTQELRKKMQNIIDFADIGDYIQEPIKHYSSGMVVRLGFAMMTALEPELLITDEVLAVGDESFQKKCIAWMQSYLQNGGTLLLCSHGMYHVQKLCTQAVWIEKGSIREYGSASDVTQSYLNYHERKEKVDAARSQAPADGHYYVKEAKICNEKGESISTLIQGQDLHIQGVIYSPDGREPVVAIGIDRLSGLAIFGTTNASSNATLTELDKHHYHFHISYPRCPLLPGEFIVKAHSMDSEALRLFDTYEMTLNVRGEAIALGSVYMEHKWHN